MIYDTRKSLTGYAAFRPLTNSQSTGQVSILNEPYDELITQVALMHENYRGPLIIFLKNRIVERLSCFAEISERYPVHFLHSVKSTDLSDLFKLSKDHLSGFDVSNLYEYQKLPDDLSGKILFLTSPIEPEALELFRVKNNSLFLIIDRSEHEKLIVKMQSNDKFGIRLNTTELLCKSGYSGNDLYTSSRFGFGINELDFISYIIEKYRDQFIGFHVHHGSDSNSADLCLALAKELILLLDKFQINKGFVDFGGGYHGLSFSELEDLIIELRNILPNGIQIFFEPGRSITEDCGFALSKICNVRKKGDTIECTLDISKECHLKWSTPKLITPVSEDGSKTEQVKLFGPTCYEDDILGEYLVSFLDNSEEIFRTGQILLFSGITSYSEAWNYTFNGITACQVKLI